MRSSEPARLATVVGLLAVAALSLATWRLATLVPPAEWWRAALHPDLDRPADLVFSFSALPRLMTAALCGGALGLAGALLQHALGNPLASPTTLGLESGGQLALTVALVLAPALLGGGREAVAFAGGALALGAVLLCARRRGLTSVSIVLAGLVVSLFCTASAAALKLLNNEYATVLYLWGGGSLEIAGWSVPARLCWPLGGLALATLLALRPLAILALPDEGARAVGASVTTLRTIALILALLLIACVVGSVGTIGFVGLAAPQIARFAGARRFALRAPLAGLVGAAIVVAVDAPLSLYAERPGSAPIPTGAATALLGAPLLVWLLPRLRLAIPPTVSTLSQQPMPRRSSPLLMRLALALVVLVVMSALFGRDAAGLSLPELGSLPGILPDILPNILPWRVPRILVAASAGALLTVSGFLLQRMTGNPLASPEVLGIGTGVALGVALGLSVDAGSGIAGLLAFGALGALGATAILIVFARRARFQPEHLLLAGIALTSLLDVFVLSFFARGDLRTGQLLAFMSGSTYRADWPEASIGLVAVALLVPCCLLLSRVLDLLLLGEEPARELGLSLGRARLFLTALTALMTAGGVVLVGPLTFVGLMGPHLARMIGFRRAFETILGAALIGALVMVLADWVARNAIYPRQLPAGLVAALIGLPYLLHRLSRRGT